MTTLLRLGVVVAQELWLVDGVTVLLREIEGEPVELGLLPGVRLALEHCDTDEEKEALPVTTLLRVGVELVQGLRLLDTVTVLLREKVGEPVELGLLPGVELVLGHCDADEDVEVLPVRALLRLGVELAQGLRLPDTLPVPLREKVGEAVEVPLLQEVGLPLGQEDDEGEEEAQRDTNPLRLTVAEAQGLADCDTLLVPLRVKEGDAVLLELLQGVGLAQGLAEFDGVTEAQRDAAALRLTVAEEQGLGDCDRLTVALREKVGEADELALLQGLGLLLGDRVGMPVAQGEGLVEPDRLPVTETVPVGLMVRECELVPDAV